MIKTSSRGKRSYRKKSAEEEQEDSEILPFSCEQASVSQNFTKLSFADEIPEEVLELSYSKSRLTIPGNDSQEAPSVDQSISNQILEKLRKERKELEIVNIEKRGRGIVTRKRLTRGDVVLRELPYAAVVDDENLTRNCSRCFQSASKMYRCSSCKVLHYCSKKCQLEEWSAFHKEECANWVRLGRHVPTAIRTICRVLIRRNKSPATFEEVENLENLKSKFLSSKLELFGQMSLVVSKVLPPSLLLSPSSMIDLFCRFTCNSFSVVDDECVGIGVGVYPLAAMVNHSCWPNCIAMFEEDQMVIRCLRDIEEGEELTISYVDIALPTEERRRELLERYFFICNCDLCQKRKPSDIDLRCAFKCSNQNCSGGLAPLDPLSEDEEYNEICAKCGDITKYDVHEIREKQEFSQMKYEKAVAFQKIDPEKAINLLEETYSLQFPLLHSLNYELLRTRQLLKILYIERQRWADALSHTTSILSAFHQLLPPHHPLLGVLQLSAAKLILHLLAENDSFEEPINLLRQAIDDLRVSHGRKSELTLEAEELLKKTELEFEGSLRNRNIP
ncbi:uncharacterized protein VTP21DRAFT_2723 [Calcarisporiella thermophila]|uniref:uncharacterized protein n=1 Tax=Calcarisporiella thermophila TaxID=911321 RepID=UPI003744767E